MGMQSFHTWIYDIYTYKEYGHNIIDTYIIYPILGIKYSQQSARTTPTSVPSTWECGGMEKKEWENREIDENLKCMDLKNETKNPSLISIEISEFPLHQPTWKGIQLPQNWFTSRESEYWPCNGQEKSIENDKCQLKNDKKILYFLMKSFY